MMMNSLLLPALLLLGGSSSGPAANSFNHGAADEGTREDEVVAPEDKADALSNEFEAAVLVWRDAMANGTKEERKALRKADPAIAFWPKFETLADAGNGRALLWMALHARNYCPKVSERGAILLPIYKTLVSDHNEAKWFTDVLGAILQDHLILTDEVTVELFVAVVEKSKSDENRAGALYHAGTLLAQSQDEKSRERGAAFLARAEAEFPKTFWGKKLAALHVQVGDMAPDFLGKTNDSFEFNLSDYRGKVVLLDFYGFW